MTNLESSYISTSSSSSSTAITIPSTSTSSSSSSSSFNSPSVKYLPSPRLLKRYRYSVLPSVFYYKIVKIVKLFIFLFII